jgi:hypothetical protein
MYYSNLDRFQDHGHIVILNRSYVKSIYQYTILSSLLIKLPIQH